MQYIVPKTYEEIIKSPIIKKVGVEPESETTPIRASGEDYDQVSQTSFPFKSQNIRNYVPGVKILSKSAALVMT